MNHPKVSPALKMCSEIDIQFVPQGGAMASARSGVFDLCIELQQYISEAPEELQEKPWKVNFIDNLFVLWNSFLFVVCCRYMLQVVQERWHFS